MACSLCRLALPSISRAAAHHHRHAAFQLRRRLMTKYRNSPRFASLSSVILICIHSFMLLLLSVERHQFTVSVPPSVAQSLRDIQPPWPLSLLGLVPPPSILRHRRTQQWKSLAKECTFGSTHFTYCDGDSLQERSPVFTSRAHLRCIRSQEQAPSPFWKWRSRPPK